MSGKKLLIGASCAMFFVLFMAWNVGAQEKGNQLWKQATGTEITVAMNLGAEAETLQKLLPEFQELTGIKVDYQVYPELELHEKTLIGFVSHAGVFDVVMQDFMFTPQYAGAKFTVPLDQYINDPKLTDIQWFKPEDFLKGLWSAIQYEGKPYAIPFTGETTLLMYRKDLLDAKGLQVPKTFEELWNVAKALNNPPEIYGIGIRGQRGQGMNIFTWTQFFRGFGGKFFKDFPKDMTPTVNSPEAIKATEFYANILKEFGPPGVANWTNMEVYAAQQQGKIAMTMDANAFGPIIDNPQNSKTAGKWEYAVVPGDKGGPAPAVYTHCLSLNNDSKNKVGAWLFIAWATGPEITKKRALATGVPPRESSWKDPEFEKQLYNVGKGTYTKMTAESLNLADGQYRPVFPHWREMGDILGAAVQAVIAGDEKAQPALDKAQEEITTMLVKNGYLKK
jgi:multiple sugar transport system substrate-binding protein